jgi:hypothetical protein
MVRWEDLAEQAEKLAKMDAGRPKETSLRRAVSTAYYAVFHELCRTVANGLASANAPDAIYARMYRLLEHKAARNFFERLRARDSKECAQLGAYGPTVLGVGMNFIQLQDDRMQADYDPLPFPYNRKFVIEKVARVRDNARVLQSLPELTKRDLAVMLITSRR